MVRKMKMRTEIVEIEKTITETEYYCDWCEAKIDGLPPADLTNFTDEGGDVYDFCSWSCLLNKLPLIEMGEFIAFSEIYSEKERDEFMSAVYDRGVYISPRPEDFEWAEQVIREIEEEE